MPGLTATEQNHWRDRITVRISRAVERMRVHFSSVFDRITRSRSAHEQPPADELTIEPCETPTTEPAEED